MTRTRAWSRAAATVLLLTAATACSGEIDGAEVAGVAATVDRARPDREVREALAAARAATAGYHRLDAATAAGFALPPAPAPLHECISALDGDGAMGLHYVNGEHASDPVLDVTRPAALVYEPAANGRLRLVAAEYVVFADAWDAEHPGERPRLFGRNLTLVEEGNRYELPAFYQVHAWLWKHNPHGMFADHNPRVSCEHATGSAAERRRHGGVTRR